jgi:type I restriction enzyme S subunit
MSSKTKAIVTEEETKAALVPKLRFPEFQSTGDWMTVKLGSVATIRTEKVGNNVCVPMSITSGVGLVSQEEKFGRVIAGDSYKSYVLLKPNDFAYNKSATKEYPEGFLALYSGTELAAVPNSIFTCFRIDGDSPDVRFLNYQFSDNLHGRWLRKFIQVGARAHGSLSINDNDLMALPVPVPAGALSIAEQQKIAECLSSVDKLIAAQTRKVDALKTHKKGLMQQLFPREGETQPRLRFAEFQNAGQWMSDSLERLCAAKISYGIVQAGPHVPNGMPYIKSTDLNAKLCLEKLARTSDAIALKYRRSEVEPDDIVFSLRGNIGAAQVVPKDISVANLTQGTARIRPQGSVEFYLQALQSPAIRNRILSVSKGSTFQEISLEALRNVQLLRPQIDEQQRVGSCLSNLDTLITAETQKLEALKTHKKGLTQKLFPSLEEK